MKLYAIKTRSGDLYWMGHRHRRNPIKRARKISDTEYRLKSGEICFISSNPSLLRYIEYFAPSCDTIVRIRKLPEDVNDTSVFIKD